MPGPLHNDYRDFLTFPAFAQGGSNLVGPGILTLWSIAAHPVGEKRTSLAEPL